MESGVSQSTVSLVLAGRGFIAEETRRRVLDAAERLRYRPNLLVHSIQTGKTRMIGVMAPPFDSYWSEVLYGIHDTLAAADCVPLMLWAPHQVPERRGRRPSAEISELEQIHRLLDRRVDGVILWPTFASVFSEHVEEFSSRDMPVVTIDHELPARFGAAYVGTDEADGGRLVANHLYQQGHRSVGQLAGPATLSWASLRRKAFEEAFAALPGTRCVTLDAPAGLPDLAIEQARALVAMAPEITAVFAATDIYAKIIYRAAAERALRIPDDLSVVGYSDDDFAEEMNPPLTTVRQPAYDIGAAAARVLLQLVNREKDAQVHAPIHEEFPVLMCVRGSTTSPRSMTRVMSPTTTSILGSRHRLDLNRSETDNSNTAAVGG